MLNFSIIIPTYNESANIVRLISEIEKMYGLESTEIIVWMIIRQTEPAT